MSDTLPLIEETIRDLEEKIDVLQGIVDRQKQRSSGYQELSDSFTLIGFDDNYLVGHYHQNMAALEKYFPDVHKAMLEYKPVRYHIDVVDNLPNIRDKETGALVYTQPAFTTSLYQYEEFCLAPKMSHSRIQYTHENPMGFMHVDYLNQLVTASDKFVEESVGGERLPKDVGMMLVFGMGLGFQVELLAINHNIHHLYIIEPDLDIFYASLFTTAWFHVLPLIDERGGTLQLSLGVEAEEFFEAHMSDSSIRGRYNIISTYGFVHYQTKAIAELLEHYKNRYYELSMGWGFYDDAVMSIAHQGRNIHNDVPFVKIAGKTAHPLKNVPVFICGNGPSLDRHAEFLRQNQDKGIVISCGTALRALKKHGITPDFHCEQERTYPIAGLLDDIKDPEFLRDRVLLAPGTVHPEVFKKFAKAFMAPKHGEPATDALESIPGFSDEFESALHINPTVANTAVFMSHALGFRTLYLFGVDLGHQRDGNHHSVHSVYYKADGADRGIYRETDDYVVPGNFGGEVVTNAFFNLSRICIERLLRRRPELMCFNLGEGALIRGAIPCNQEDVLLASGMDKADVMEMATHFNVDSQGASRFEAPYWDCLAPPKVDALSEALLDILQPDVDSRRAGSLQMEEVMERLRDESRAGRPYLNSLFEGSMLYYHAVLVRVLYAPTDDTRCVAAYNELKQIYLDFLRAVPAHYRMHYQRPNSLSLQEGYNDWIVTEEGEGA